MTTTDLITTLRRGDVAGTAALFAGADEARRRTLGAELARRHREFGWYGSTATALAVAVVAGLPDAAQAATVLHRDVVPTADAAGPVIAAARERRLTWLGDLAARLAAGLTHYPFVTDLLRAEGVKPPGSERFVRHWLGYLDRPVEALRPSRSWTVSATIRSCRYCLTVCCRRSER
ncbi:hypothetical protein ABZS66_52550 [Dactylosporangium sp. NPDC005572]|uniref:hypothetical protein n=1 Tax=Dactylosporangium sp. NPDC005572 TaxID=3156889 RepID=UPI0033B7F35E